MATALAVIEQYTKRSPIGPRRHEAKGPPDYQYIVSLWHELEMLYADQDDQIRRMRAVRQLKQPSGLPQTLRLVDVEVRDPTATDEIQRVVATLTVNEPKLTVTPARPGDLGEKNAELRRKWTQALLRVCGRRVPGIDTFTALTDSVVGDGGGWTTFVNSNDLWDVRYGLDLDNYEDPGQFNNDVEDAKKAAGPPFSWICPDVLTLYPVWTGMELTEMIEVQRRPLYSTLRQYNLRLTSDGKILPDELGQGTDWAANVSGASVTFVQHWTKTHCSYVIVGQAVGGETTSTMVDQWEHGMGRVPYFYAPGLQMNFWRNRKVGWGISEAKRWLVEYRSFLWTLHAQHAARDTLPPVMEITEVAGAESVVGEDQRPATSEIWELRQIIKLAPGKKLVPFQFPDVSNSIKEQIAMVSEAIQKIDTPRVESIGQGVEGAGFAINQQLSETKVKFAPLGHSIERHLGDVTRFAWKLTRDVVGETVWIQQDGDQSGWLSAGPEDLPDGVGVEWELDAEQPSAKLIEERMHGELVTNGFESKDQAIEALGGNPDEVRLGILLDKIRASDAYTKLVIQEVMEAVGRGDQIAQAAQAQQMAQSGQVPGATNPAAMGGAPGSAPDMGQAALGPSGAVLPQQAAQPGQPQVPVTPRGTGVVVPTTSAGPGMQQFGGAQ